MGSIIYLGCPYTHTSPEIREDRFDKATTATAYLVAQKHVVFSPITMTHPVDVKLAGRDSTLGSEFWVQFDEAFMDCCARCVVLTLDGWRESKGIAREIEYFGLK